MTLSDQEYYWMIGCLLSAGRNHRFADSPVIRVTMPYSDACERLAALTGPDQEIKIVSNIRTNSKEVRIRSREMIERVLSDTDSFYRVPDTGDDDLDRVMARGAFEVSGDVWIEYNAKDGSVTPFVRQRTSTVVFDWLEENNWVFDYEVDKRDVAPGRVYKTVTPRSIVYLEGPHAAIYLDWLYGNNIAPQMRCADRYGKYQAVCNMMLRMNYNSFDAVHDAMNGRSERFNIAVKVNQDYYTRFTDRIYSGMFSQGKDEDETRK